MVVVTGAAGSGKSSLAAALARPEITRDRVPREFVHAIAVLGGETESQSALARELAAQLEHSLPGFAAARAAFEQSVPENERNALAPLTRMVLRPIEYLEGAPEVRIVLDGFDQIPEITRKAVGEALASAPRHLRLVITARSDTPGCPPGHPLELGRTPIENLARYLTSRRVPDAARSAILDRAGGQWLFTHLMAEAVRQAVRGGLAIDLTQLPGTVNEAYARLLDLAGAGDEWKQRFCPVIAPLAVAGDGPVLPVSLLARVSQALGGPERVDYVREVLDRLRGLLVRRDAGDAKEHVGLFHTTLADYLLGPSASRAGYPLDVRATHQAMIRAIDTLAPMAEHKNDDPIHHYAFLREAEHLWALDDTERTLASLLSRKAYSPRENLDRWRQWPPRFRDRFDENDAAILRLRSGIAYWTGRAGDSREALRLFSKLLPDQERVLGRDHPDTLRTCSNIAGCSGRVGDSRDALRLLTELLPDQERVLGRDHADTLRTRSNVASWTGEVGDSREALRLFSKLLPDQERVLGRDHPDTLRTRNNIAFRTGEVGDSREALRLLTELLPDLERVLGRDHPGTLTTRSNIANWTGRAGDSREALRLFSELLPDLERVLGRDHPDTLTTRGNIAGWTGEVGDSREALRLFSELLPDQERVLGRDHPHTLITRSNIAGWTGRVGDWGEALRLFTELLPDQERVQGRDHPEALRTLGWIGVMALRNGDRAEGCRWLYEGLKRAEARFGLEHPLTAQWQGRVQSHGCAEPGSSATPGPEQLRGRRRCGRGRSRRGGGPYGAH